MYVTSEDQDRLVSNLSNQTRIMTSSLNYSNNVNDKLSSSEKGCVDNRFTKQQNASLSTKSSLSSLLRSSFLDSDGKDTDSSKERDKACPNGDLEEDQINVQRKPSQRKIPFFDRLLHINLSDTDSNRNSSDSSNILPNLSIDCETKHFQSIRSADAQFTNHQPLKSRSQLTRSYSGRTSNISIHHPKLHHTTLEDDISSSCFSTSLNSETSSINSDAALLADIGAGLKSRHLREHDEFYQTEILKTRQKLQDRLVTRLKDRYQFFKKLSSAKLGSGATAHVKVMTLKPDANFPLSISNRYHQDGFDPRSTLFAVKIYRKKTKNETETEFLEKLATEWSIHAQLNHPNIVTALELCIDHHTLSQDSWCSVMEFCDGGDLFNLMISHKTFGIVEKICTFKQVVRAVAYLHKLGIAHRDIKPENVLLTKAGLIKLTDFGTSDLCCPGCKEGCESHAKHQKHRYCRGKCGSTPYMAPELIAIKDLNDTYDGFAVDYWALGVLLFAILTGGAPWHYAHPGDKLFTYYVTCLEKHKARLQANAEEISTSSASGGESDEDLPRDLFDKIHSFVSLVNTNLLTENGSVLVKETENVIDYPGNAGGAPLKLPLSDRLPSCKIFSTRITHTGQLRLLYGFLALIPSQRLSAFDCLQDNWFKNAECCQLDVNEHEKELPLFDVTSNKPIPRRMTVKSKHKHVPEE